MAADAGTNERSGVPQIQSPRHEDGQKPNGNRDKPEGSPIVWPPDGRQSGTTDSPILFCRNCP